MNNTKKRPITAKLRTKENRYYAVFYCPSNVGQPKEVWRTLNLEVKAGNKRNAIDRMEKMRKELSGVIDVPGYDISFVDYMRSWKSKKENEVEETTFAAISGIVEGKICSFFEPMKLRLSEVKPKHISRFYDHLYKHGRVDGGGLSISSLKTVKSILNEAFKRAIVDDLVIINPVDSVKLPAKDNPRKPHTVLNNDSANLLLGSVIDDDIMYPLLLITLRYGLRQSEVIGLKWSAIDFRNNILRIESVITGGKNPEKNRTKTKTSNATFPLLPEIKEALMLRQRSQDRNRTENGESYVETDYVFTNYDGRFLKAEWVRKRFKEALSACGLPPMRFHDLRHSTACIMHERGTGLKELQKWMRHGKMEMTADVYLHVSKEREDKLADSLQDMFSAAPASQDMISHRKFGA